MGHASSILLRDTVPTLRSAEGDNPLRLPSIARTEHERRPLDPEAANAVREYGDLGRRGNEEGRSPRSCRPSIPRSRAAALYDRKSSVTNRSGIKAYFFKSLRISSVFALTSFTRPEEISFFATLCAAPPFSVGAATRQRSSRWPQRSG